MVVSAESVVALAGSVLIATSVESVVEGAVVSEESVVVGDGLGPINNVVTNGRYRNRENTNVASPIIPLSHISLKGNYYKLGPWWGDI